MSTSEPGSLWVRHRKALNLLFLIGGYSIGQGSIFLTQSWLVVTNQLAQLASFGTAFSFAMLAITLVEAGSITVLARAVAMSSIDDDNYRTLWRSFWSVSAVRLMYSVVAISFFITSSYLSADPHYIAYALSSSPAYLIWALNCAGILDGRNRSGVSGISGAIPYLFSALVVPFSAGLPVYTSGLIQGGALSVGYALTVGCQYAFLAYTRFYPRFTAVKLSDIWRSAVTSAHMIAGTLPGQLFYRIQLLICAVYLSKDTTAIFVYGYQILSAFVQIVSFIRRVEFPRLLVDANKRDRLPSVSTVFYAQRTGTLLSVAMSVALIAGSAVGLFALTGNLATASYVLLLLSPLLLTSAVALALSQGAHAFGRHGWPAVSSNLGAAVGLLLSLALVSPAGLLGLAAGNVTAQLVSALYLLWCFWRTETIRREGL